MKKMRINTLVCIMLTLALVVSNFAGLDLGIVEAHADVQLEGSGTEDDPYQINDYAGLKNFADIVNYGYTSAYAQLTSDIVCNDKTWTPIGIGVKVYSGCFDGQGYVITGLSNRDIADKDSRKFQGLIGYNSGTVINVNLKDTDITGNTFVGGVVGYNNTGTISNCSNTGMVSGQNNNIGGVVGYNKGTVTSCSNTGTVSGQNQNVGGVAGYNDDTITNSCNMGEISGKTYTGGVAGYNTGTLTNSYNTGAVSGQNNNIGGVVGYNTGTLTICYNTGTVSGQTNNTGGVVGYNNGTLTTCHNRGEISGGFYTGGVAGYNIKNITNCYNIGTVSGKNNNTGGVAGYNKENITNCYNIAKVLGQGNYTGGVAGYNEKTISNSYNTGEVLGQYKKTGGVAGYNKGTIKNTYYDSERADVTTAIGDGAGSGENVKGLTTAQMTGPEALSSSNMSFPAPEGETTYVNPWVIKADYIDGDWFVWYYPHLKGFDYDENGNVIEVPEKITIWPANIEGRIEYIESESYVFTGYAIRPTISKIVIGDDYVPAGVDAYYSKLDLGNVWFEIPGKPSEPGRYKLSYTVNKSVEKCFAITESSPKYYKKTGENTWEEIDSGNDCINAGTYCLRDTERAIFTKEFTITPKTLSDELQNITIELSPENATYDGIAKEPSVTVKDGEKTVDSKEYQVSFANNVNAGTATVTISDEDGGNYIVSGTKTFEIKKAEAEIDNEPSVINDLTYNGKPQALVNAGTAKDNQKLVYALGSDSVNAPAPDAEGTPETEKKWKETVPSATNAGTYYVWYKIVVDNNHKLENEKAEYLTVTISRKSVTVTADNKTKDAGTTDEQLTATVSGLADGEIPDLISYSLSREAGEAAGTYTINVSGEAEQNNYTVTFVLGTYTIKAVIVPSPYVIEETEKITVTETDSCKTTVTTIINADKSVTEKTVKEFKNGNTVTEISLTDKNGNTIINASEAVNVNKKGTRCVNVSITDISGYSFRNEVETTKSGKETVISETKNPDGSSSYVKMVTKPNGKVTRNSIETNHEGRSVITIGNYKVDPENVSTGNTGIIDALIKKLTGNNNIDASTLDSVADMLNDTFEFHSDSLPGGASTVSEMIYEAAPDGKAKLAHCETVLEEITVLSKIRINGKIYSFNAIAKGAFKGCDNLKKVKLGKSITTIGAKAFADLENLEEIVFLSTSKDGIKIRKGAFNGISPEAKFYSKASAEARQKTLKRIKKSGYKTITEVTKI